MCGDWTPFYTGASVRFGQIPYGIQELQVRKWSWRVWTPALNGTMISSAKATGEIRKVELSITATTGTMPSTGSTRSTKTLSYPLPTILADSTTKVLAMMTVMER